MHVVGRGTSLSWIPSESVSGWLKSGFDLHLSHYDKPPVDVLSGVEQVEQMRADDRFRFANVISGWADFTGPRPGAGWSEESGLLMGSTTVRLALGSATFMGYSLPVLREISQPDDDTFVLTQTVGGRTGVPLPRKVRHPPFVRWQAPIVWTTLALTLRRGGTTQVELVGASAFPRHWVYDDTGSLAAKSGVAQLQDWLDHSFGPRTPWGSLDSTALVVAAESAIERRLSGDIMAGGRHRGTVRPEVRNVPEGYVLTRQGEPGGHVFLVLDGVLDVLVDGELVAEVGPGAVVGERAVVGDGLRTATVRARTRARLGRVLGTDLDTSSLHELSLEHHREDALPEDARHQNGQHEAMPGE